MFRMMPTSTHRSNVTAFFRDGSQSFRLPEGETLGDLAGRIEALGTRHAGSPISIQVHFELPVVRPILAASQH